MKNSSTWLQDGCKMVQHSAKMVQHSPKMVQHSSKMTPTCPNIASRWTNLAPRGPAEWSEKSTKINTFGQLAQHGSKMAQNSFKMVQHSPKLVQHGPKNDTKSIQKTYRKHAKSNRVAFMRKIKSAAFRSLSAQVTESSFQLIEVAISDF